MDETFDVVVVGSGASGLTAALTAAKHGLSVAVVEKSASIGGTSVISGGSIWAPVNRFMAGAGQPDDREAALTYLRRLALGRVDDALIVRFVDEVNPMLDLLGTETGLAFEPNLEHPDYQPHLPGACSGGRTLQGGLYDTTRLGELKSKLRPTHSTVPVTKLEIDEWGMDTLDRWDWELITQRTIAGVVGMGSALVGELLEGCVRHGVKVYTDAPATGLVRNGDAVTGVGIGVAGDRVRARLGVVLASGGFEWDRRLVDQFLGVPMVAPASPPANSGDGLRMAMSVGAALGNMSEAWWGPMVDVVGDTYDGAPLHRPTSGLRALPGGIMVNRRGWRFVDEAMNYNDLGKALATFDPIEYEYAHQPCWLIFDERFRRSYSVATVTPETPTPPWMLKADTVRELAELAAIDPDGLVEQVADFNAGAADGRDPAFHRGESVYDRYRGDPAVTPHRNLRPLIDGPFYAVRIYLGCLGTKGGPQTDVNGQVLGVDDCVIPGLYACGNVAASPFGPGYPGAGATLAVGMTYGYVIGNALAAKGRS